MTRWKPRAEVGRGCRSENLSGAGDGLSERDGHADRLSAGARLDLEGRARRRGLPIDGLRNVRDGVDAGPDPQAQQGEAENGGVGVVPFVGGPVPMAMPHVRPTPAPIRLPRMIPWPWRRTVATSSRGRRRSPAAVEIDSVSGPASISRPSTLEPFMRSTVSRFPALTFVRMRSNAGSPPACCAEARLQDARAMTTARPIARVVRLGSPISIFIPSKATGVADWLRRKEGVYACLITGGKEIRSSF